MNLAADEFACLAGTYRLLARLWIREVDRQLVEILLAPPLADVFAAAGGALPASAAPAALDELAVDYCRLFLGPANHLPPFQSVWQRGQFQSASAESMQHYVSVAGSETGGLMPDHLGVQLDVMGRLLDFGPESVQPSDDLAELAANYFSEHLTWAAPLFDAAFDRAETEFYRSMIRMTRDFLSSEAAYWAAVRA